MAQPFGLAGVMGWPVSHSRSPLMHNLWLKQHGIAGVYVPLPVQPERLGDALRGLPALGFAGCNLTIPHKVAAMAYMDEIDPLARRMGAMNLVVVGPEGRLTAHRTGVRRDLRATGNPAVEAGARTRPCDGERFGHADEPGPPGVPGLVWRDARDHA